MTRRGAKATANALAAMLAMALAGTAGLAGLAGTSGSAWAQPGAQPSPGQPAPPQPGQPGAQPAPPAAPTAVPRRPLTPQEMEVLAEVERDFLRYRDAANNHQTQIRRMLVREFDKRKRTLEKRYAERIAQTEAQKKRRHLDAIALLEKFIADHPNHPQFTPDAMFRLADLYLDAAEAELEAQEAAGDFTETPIADYSRSLALWQQIIERFPDYRQFTGTLYLLAYYGNTKDERRSLKLFLALACANKHSYTDPTPPEPTEEQARAMLEGRVLRNAYADCVPMKGADAELIQHAWVRGVGDHHFLIPGELDEAIAAYTKITADPSSSLYPEALYKLSWSYYRRDFPLEAIQGFDESVRIYDATVARGDTPRLALRGEALQYIAVSFTDPWEGELEPNPVLGLQRAQEFYQGNEQTYVRDVWETLGTAFMELQAYDQAIVAFETAIARPWHLHPNNPVVHQEIVNAYEAKGDKRGADLAAAELATRYAPGTEWFIANEKDRRAMLNQRQIGERMLYAAARNTHAEAGQLRADYEAAGGNDPEARRAYLELYAKAVALYRSFLQQYPESEHTYDFTFGMAEAMYFSGRERESIEHYRWVRDHRELSEKHFEDAARSIIQAYEAEVAKQVAAGTLQPLQIPDVAALRAMPRPIQPRPIPELYLELQQAWDEYQTLVNEPKTAPRMGLNAALVSVSFLHLDDAIARYQKVLDKFCGTPAAVTAKDGLLSVYDGLGDAEKFKQTNEAFINSKCGDAESIELARSQNRSIEFRKASDLFASGKYPEAAKEFYVYYKTAPDDDPDLPTALYNSAIAFREADKPKTAIYLLKEFTDNKSPLFRKSPYYLEALRLTAIAHQSVFDYDAAIDAYMLLYRQAKDATRRGLTPPPPPPGEQPKTFEQVKLDALYNAAVLRELQRDFRAAIKLYRQYEREEDSRRNQDRALWAIARIYRASGDTRNLVDTYAAWRRKYGNDDGNVDDYVFSFYDTAQAYAKRGNTREADKYRRQTIEAWQRKGSIKGGRGAELAGEYELLFAERHFAKTFASYRIKTRARNEKQAQALKKKLQDVTKATQDKYLELSKYGVVAYTMASNVRYGETLADYAQKLFEMPTPKYIIDLDARAPEAEVLVKYEDALRRNLEPMTQQAKEYWVRVVDAGKSKNISNRWTRLALDNLNKEFPDEFPILHEELTEGTEDP